MPDVSPQNLLTRLENLVQDKKIFWSCLNKVHQKKFLGFPNYNWNDDVFIPASIWSDMLDDELCGLLKEVQGYYPANRTRLQALMMCLTAWRFTQGCYTIHDRLFRQFYKAGTGGIISTEHLHRMKEWTIYIPCDTRIGNAVVHGFFIHKTNIAHLSPSKSTNALIIVFNTVIEGLQEQLMTLPFAVFNACNSGKPSDCVMNFELPVPINTSDDLNEIIGPYLSVFNFVFDQETVIESDIVGIQTPELLDVKHHYNFNAFNIAHFKYSAPSNIRSWNAGLNFIVEENQLKRANPSGQISEACWLVTDHILALKRPTILN